MMYEVNKRDVTLDWKNAKTHLAIARVLSKSKTMIARF